LILIKERKRPSPGPLEQGIPSNSPLLFCPSIPEGLEVLQNNSPSKGSL